MHRSESRELLSCAVCGRPADSRKAAYAFAVDSVLCFECALERGGSYDADEDTWTEHPDVTDLAEPEA